LRQNPPPLSAIASSMMVNVTFCVGRYPCASSNASPVAPGGAYGRFSAASASSAVAASRNVVRNVAVFALSVCAASVGRAIALSTPMTTITTSSSMSVKPPSRSCVMSWRIARSARRERHPVG
jgi:hypothetical protein